MQRCCMRASLRRSPQGGVTQAVATVMASAQTGNRVRTVGTVTPPTLGAAAAFQNVA